MPQRFYLPDDNLISDLPRPHAQADLVSDLTVTTSTFTVVDWPAENFDNDSMHDLITENKFLTIKTAGIYYVYASINWASNTTGKRRILLQLEAGGTTFGANYGNSDGLNYQTVIAIINLAVNDELRCTVYQSSGGDLALKANAGTYFGAYKLDSIT